MCLTRRRAVIGWPNFLPRAAKRRAHLWACRGSKDGCVDEFGEFFEARYGGVLRSVALIVGDPNRAEDATQEAFLQAFRKWRSVRAMAKPESWVLVVAINAERRRWRRSPRQVGEEEAPAAVVGDHAGMVTTTIALRDAMAQLTIRQRAVVVLRYLADLPVPEIANALGCAEGTVRATLHQSLSKLQVELAEGEL